MNFDADSKNDFKINKNPKMKIKTKKRPPKNQKNIRNQPNMAQIIFYQSSDP